MSQMRHVKKHIVQYERDLDHASDYACWRQISLELDRLEGSEAWKQDDTSDDYDHFLLRERIIEMRELRARTCVRPLVFALYEGLHGNLGNSSNPMLYGLARVGTKHLIEQYAEEVVRCLDYVCAGDFPDFSTEEKILFFKRTGTAFGRSALMLSGGGTLGMFHLGVIKALHEQNLLPRVISGSSAGAIIGGAVGVRDDSQITRMLAPGGLNLEAFERVTLGRAMKNKAVMDTGQLEQCLATNMGEETFLEAFERTRRIIGITVSTAEAHQQPRLLNYLTAPNVVVRRAILASCAVPGVFPPVMLQARDYNGQIVPYMPSKRWMDGTLSSDLPMLRLARLHNVNHYIVSQTNPHVVPFLRERTRKREQSKRGMAPLVKDLVIHGGAGALKLARRHLDPYGSGRVVAKLDNVVRQRYSGDINLYPERKPSDLLNTFSNPSHDDIRRYIAEGERATWPKIERIRIQTRISRAFEDCLLLLKQRLHEKPKRKFDLRLAAAR